MPPGLPPLRSPAGLGSDNPEVIPVVLANHFVERDFQDDGRAGNADRVPWHRKCAGVLDADLTSHVPDQPETLHDVELGRVRRAIIVHIGPVVQADRVDHQRVAVFAADGLAVPRRLDRRWGTFRYARRNWKSCPHVIRTCFGV